MALHNNADFIIFTGFLTVILLTLPFVSTENIDCKGKAFYCVNSTHFKICVDFGGGVSKTVDEFLIPCPTNTVCRDINKFECEYQVTTTLAPLRQSDVTNEQTELSVWDNVDVTTLFPEYKTNKIEELKNYYDVSVTTIELSSSAVSNDTTDYISSPTLDGRPNQVNLSSENKIQNFEKSDLSDSVTVSYDPASSFDLMSNNDEFLTTTAKVTVKDTLLNISLHTNTTAENSRDDLSLATTVQIFEGVTKRNLGLEPMNSSDSNVSINNEYNENETFTLSPIVTEIKKNTPSEIFENTIPSSAETFSVTKDPLIDSNTLTTLSNLNIENVTNYSLINLLNYDTTTNSYNTEKDQTSQTNLEPFNDVKLNITVDNSILNIMDDVTMPTNIQIYNSTENILSKSLTNEFNIENTTSIDDGNITETLYTLSSTFNEFFTTTSFESTNEKLIIESTLQYNVENLITPTTDTNYPQNYEKNVTSAIDTIDIYSLNRNQTNNSADISDKPYVVNLTESNPTTPYVGLITEYSFNSTIITNHSLTNIILKSNTSADHLSLNLLDLNNSKRYLTNESVLNSVYPNNVSNETIYIVEVSTDDMDKKLPVYVNNISSENNVQNITYETDFTGNKTSTSIENTSIATTLLVALNNSTIPIQINSVRNMTGPLINLNSSNIDVTSNSGTSLQYESLPERYQSITTVSFEAYRNQESRHFLSTSQTSDVKEKIISTTTIYFNRDVDTNKDKKLDDFFYLAKKKRKTFENITTIEEPAALLNISNKNYDNLNMYSSVIASSETISIQPITMQTLNESSKTYLDETMLRATNITDKNDILYAIDDIIENVSSTTQINEEVFEVFNVSSNKLNKNINNSFTNDELITKTTLPLLKQELATLKSYENKATTDINTNEIISTTEAGSSIVNSILFLIGHVESTKAYSAKNVLDITIFHKENVTNSNADNNILSIHYNTSQNMSKLHNFSEDKKGSMLEPNVTSPLPMKITSVPFDNIFEAKTLDFAPNLKNIAQTTSRTTILKRNGSDILSTKNNHINANNKPTVTSIESNNAVLNNVNHNDFLKLQNKPISSFDLPQTFKSLINNTALKFNSTSLIKQNFTSRSNETLIKLFETDTNRNASLNNYDIFLKKGRLQNTYYDNNIQKQPEGISTSTEERFLTEVMPIAPYRINQKTLLTEEFTCINRDRGKYSDKNNCNKFYICIGKLQPIIGMCPADTVFSEINKQCTRNLSHCIRNNEFRCLSSGRFMDVLSGEFYYICVKKLDGYVRFKLQCQKGYLLNKENIQCSSDTTSFESISKTISDKSTKEIKSKEIKHSQKYEIQFNCEKVGKYEHPDDCRKYFVCTKSSKSKFRRKIKKCDSDEVFNKEKSKCVDSDSYEC